MSTRLLLQLLLLVQAAAAGAIAYAAMRFLGVASPVLAIALGLVLVLLVRMLISANNFVMSARFGSPAPADFRLDWRARLRLFGEEFLASMLDSSWFMARAKARQRIFADSRALPVLLLHGYGANSGYWAHLAPLFDAAHISHASLDLVPITGGIDDYVPMVHRAAEALCAAAGASRLIIVAHSMGGLVARAYLRAHGSGRVARVITLATPHHGTSLANFAIGRNAAQMQRLHRAKQPESAWLRALAAGESAATRGLVTSLYTYHDNIVAPQSSCVLPGARNIGFGGVGHVAMGRNPRILAQVMREIATLAQP